MYMSTTFIVRLIHVFDALFTFQYRPCCCTVFPKKNTHPYFRTSLLTDTDADGDADGDSISVLYRIFFCYAYSIIWHYIPTYFIWAINMPGIVSLNFIKEQ